MEKKPATYTGSFRETSADLCRDDTDGLAGARKALLGSGYLTIFAQAISGGTFFTALLIAMGADEAYIGYVTMATTLCMAAQFPAPLFWERQKTRKGLILWLGVVGDFLTYLGLPIAAILPVSHQWKLGLYMAMTLLSGLINQFCLPARNAWMMQSIPFSKRVSYTSLTSMVHSVINVISVFLAGLMLDGFEAAELSLGSISPTLWALFLLRILAFATSSASNLWMALRIREFAYDSEEKTAVRLSVLLEPIRNKPFFRMILLPCLWALLNGMIGNYFNLHLIENVKMSYTVISSAIFINTPMILLITPIWTKILRQNDWIKSLAWGILGFSLAWCCNVLISPQAPVFYFIAIIVGFLFSPGINMVNTNLIYVHMPKENRTAYFAFYSLMTTVFTFIGQAFGTWFITATTAVRFTLFGIEIVNLQLISAVAAFFAVIFAATLLIAKARCTPGEDQL